MRKTDKAVGIAAMVAGCLLLASCATFTSIPFEPVFEGRYLEEPVDLDNLKSAVRAALVTFNWRAASESAGVVAAEYQKGGGNVRAEIKVLYSPSGYRIEYADSKGLDVDLNGKTIHRNYVRWMGNLDRQIYINYIQ